MELEDALLVLRPMAKDRYSHPELNDYQRESIADALAEIARLRVENAALREVLDLCECPHFLVPRDHLTEEVSDEATSDVKSVLKHELAIMLRNMADSLEQRRTK